MVKMVETFPDLLGHLKGQTKLMEKLETEGKKKASGGRTNKLLCCSSTFQE